MRENTEQTNSFAWRNWKNSLIASLLTSALCYDQGGESMMKV